MSLAAVLALPAVAHAAPRLQHVQTFTDGQGGAELEKLTGIDLYEGLGRGANDYLYAVGWDDALNVYRRNTDTGRLTLIQVLRDGETVGGKLIDGLNDATRVTSWLSTGTIKVAVTGQSENEVPLFAADPDDGLLEPVDLERDGSNDPSDSAGTVDGLNGPLDLDHDPQTGALYVSGLRDDAIASFRAFNDELIFNEVIKNGGGANLDGAYGVKATSRGLLVTAFFSQAVNSFDTASTGEMTFRDSETAAAGRVGTDTTFIATSDAASGRYLIGGDRVAGVRQNSDATLTPDGIRNLGAKSFELTSGDDYVVSADFHGGTGLRLYESNSPASNPTAGLSLIQSLRSPQFPLQQPDEIVIKRNFPHDDVYVASFDGALLHFKVVESSTTPPPTGGGDGGVSAACKKAKRKLRKAKKKLKRLERNGASRKKIRKAKKEVKRKKGKKRRAC